MWREGVEIAEQAVRDANAEIARVCEERGVPAEFRPRVDLLWISRGRNMEPARRTELRKLATARIDQMAKTAKIQIDAQVADVAANLLAGGLTSKAALEFLGSMPDPRSLMPAIELADLKQVDS